MKPIKGRIVSKHIRNAARGQNCQIQAVGICSHNPEETVFAHVQVNGGGMASKEFDLCGAFACYNCHNFLDGKEGFINHPEREHLPFYQLRGVVNTQAILYDMGILKIEKPD